MLTAKIRRPNAKNVDADISNGQIREAETPLRPKTFSVFPESAGFSFVRHLTPLSELRILA